MIDPIEHLIEVFRLEKGQWTLVGTAAGDEPQALEPFDDAPLDLAFLWSR